MYVAAYVTSTLLQSLRFHRRDKKLVYTAATLRRMCHLRELPRNRIFLCRSVCVTYAKSLTFLIVYTVTRISGDVIYGKMMTK